MFEHSMAELDVSPSRCQSYNMRWVKKVNSVKKQKTKKIKKKKKSGGQINFFLETLSINLCLHNTILETHANHQIRTGKKNCLKWYTMSITVRNTYKQIKVLRGYLWLFMTFLNFMISPDYFGLWVGWWCIPVAQIFIFSLA